MKPKLVTAILLFISAYAPLFLILAVKDFDFDELQWFKHPVAVLVLLAITVLSIVSLFVTMNKLDKGNMAVKVVSIKDRSSDLINYTIPYILSFFGFDLSKWGDVISLGIFLSIMMLLTIKSKAVFLNPMLAMRGYGLYDLEYSFGGSHKNIIILSNYDLKPGLVCHIRSLSRFLYVVTETKEGANG